MTKLLSMSTIKLLAFFAIHTIMLVAIVRRLISLYGVVISVRSTDKRRAITGELIWLGFVLLVAYLLIRFALYDMFYKDFLL